MTCENNFSQVNKIPRGVTVAVVRAKEPHPYFDPKVDWQAGRVNPNIARIEEIIRQREEQPNF